MRYDTENSSSPLPPCHRSAARIISKPRAPNGRAVTAPRADAPLGQAAIATESHRAAGRAASGEMPDGKLYHLGCPQLRHILQPPEGKSLTSRREMFDLPKGNVAPPAVPDCCPMTALSPIRGRANSRLHCLRYWEFWSMGGKW